MVELRALPCQPSLGQCYEPYSTFSSIREIYTTLVMFSSASNRSAVVGRSWHQDGLSCQHWLPKPGPFFSMSYLTCLGLTLA